VIRERTVAWSDPKPTADAGRGMASLDLLRGVRDGQHDVHDFQFAGGMISSCHGGRGPAILALRCWTMQRRHGREMAAHTIPAGRVRV
jgi:hypothetical protein